MTMMKRNLQWFARLTALLLTAWTLSACDATSTDRVLAIDAEGSVLVFVFLDENDDGQFNTSELRVRNAQVDLQLRGDPSLVPGGVTDSLGRRAFRVPVGRYGARVASPILGDTLLIASGTQEFTLGADDSVIVTMALTFKTVSVAEMRALPVGRKVWMRGVALNNPSLLGDSTVHVVGDSVAIRLTSVRPGLAILQGDTIRVLGRRAVRDGQPVIQNLATAPVYVPGSGAVPPPDSLNTLLASNADGGKRDARLVKIAAATISDTVTVSGNKVLTVNDTSGPLKVVLTGNGFNPLTRFRPGVRLDLVGLLVPDAGATGTWLMKPRGNTDIVILP
jgi:hypothetical protein